jgi:hypothetical protein
MTNNHRFPQPVPTPLCKSFAELLPVLDEPAVDAQAAARARAHAATCAYCQSQLATYDHLEAALRQHLGPAGTPLQHTEQIMRNLVNNRAVQEREVNRPTPPPALPDPHRPGRSRRFVVGLASLAAVLVVVVLIAGLLVNRANQGQGTGPQTGSPTTAAATYAPTSSPSLPQSTDTELNSISMVSPNEGWAVGVREFSDHAASVLMHYHNGIWSEYPNTFDVPLTSVSMASATDGWAASNTELLHYDGERWTLASNLITCSEPSMQMVSATDGWRTGCIRGSGGTRGALFHYDGQTWTFQQVPASLNPNLYFFGLSMVSSTEGWAVGNYDTSAGSEGGVPCLSANSAILHYQDGQWTVQSTIKGAHLNAISMASAGDGWASGPKTDACGDDISGTSVLMHYTQGQWKQVTHPLPGSNATGFYLVRMASAGDVWMATSGDPASTRALLHWNGTTWQETSLPTSTDATALEISSIATIAPGDAWALGMRATSAQEGTPAAGGQSQLVISPVIFHYTNGAWQVVQSE